MYLMCVVCVMPAMQASDAGDVSVDDVGRGWSVGDLTISLMEGISRMVGSSRGDVVEAAGAKHG